jgi:hypothetical protein
MSRYFFDVENGHRLIDPAGLDCRDEEEARDQAIHIAHQIAMEAPHTSVGRQIAILNSDRQEIGKVPVRLNGKAAPGSERSPLGVLVSCGKEAEANEDNDRSSRNGPGAV